MVQLASKDNETLYECVLCGLHYREREWAERCEAWCKEHPSCNLAIARFAEERITKGNTAEV